MEEPKFWKYLFDKDSIGCLLGKDRYDSLPLYLGAYDLDGGLRISPNYMHWKDVTPLYYSSWLIQIQVGL